MRSNAVELKINDRITATIVLVGCSAFEGSGQDQVVTIWADDREVARLSRHRCRSAKGFFNWHPWYELIWTGRSEQPLVPTNCGLLEYVGIVNDILA